MPSSDPVRDIMRRTMKNLAFAENNAQPDGPYEVTQLINSFLGALSHPWEAMRAELKALPLYEAERRDWPSIHKELQTDRDPASLGKLISLMRNSFAHGNIVLLPGPGGDINEMYVWNTRSNDGPRTWGAVISVKDARTFLQRFAELADEIKPHQPRAASRTA